MEKEKLFELARKGDPDACNKVGDMYYEGNGVRQDIAKAMEYYLVAEKAGHVEAKYSVGYAYLYGENGETNYARAFECLEYAAQRNHAKACRILGFAYFWGNGVDVDMDASFRYMLWGADLGDASAQAHVAQAYEGEMWGAPGGCQAQARKYYELALAQNSEHAQWCMGYNYHGGYNGYPQDYQKAFYYFKLSAENGSNKGQFYLAMCYSNGEGTAVDWAEAKKWLEIAVENGNLEAAGRLGILLLGGTVAKFSKANTRKAYGLLKDSAAQGDHAATAALEDLEKSMRDWNATLDSWTTTMLACEQESLGNGPQAVKLYKEAAEENSLQAMTFLGILYLRGMPGVPKDPNLAVQWFRKGAQAGNKAAQMNLGICYLEGNGVSKNVREAEKWLKLAADQGETGAMFCLADIYREEPGKYHQAEILYKRVIAAGDIPDKNLTMAKCSLGLLYGLQEKFALAVPLLKEAAQEGDEIAQKMLGDCYFEGCGVPRNVEEAIRWWKQAAANGSVEAQEALQQVTPGLQGYQQSQQNKKDSGGCYVATAVYGSYDCPQVWTLRRFRDDRLAETWYGRVFVRVYYAVSPTVVKWFGKSAWFVHLCKPFLDRLVANLNSEGIEDTPYHDRCW